MARPISRHKISGVLRHAGPCVPGRGDRRRRLRPDARRNVHRRKGAGAFLNGQRLHVSKYAKLSESLLATGFPPFDDRHNINIQLFLEFTTPLARIRRAGSAALDLCSVAAALRGVLGTAAQFVGQGGRLADDYGSGRPRLCLQGRTHPVATRKFSPRTTECTTRCCRYSRKF